MENSILEIPNNLPAAEKRYEELLEYERKLDKLFRMLDRFLKEGKRGDMTDEYFAKQMKRADKTRRNMSAEKNALEEKLNELRQDTGFTGEQNVIFKKSPLKLILKKSSAQKIPTKTTSFPKISVQKVKLVHISPMVLPEVLRPKNVSLTQELQPFKTTEKRVISCGIPKCIPIISRGYERKHSLHVSSKTGLLHLSLDLSLPTASGPDLSRAFTTIRQRVMLTLAASTMQKLRALEKLMPLKQEHVNLLEVKQPCSTRWTLPRSSFPAVLLKNDLKCLINVPQPSSQFSAFLLLQQLIRRVNHPRAFSITQQPMMLPSPTSSKMQQQLCAPGKLMPLEQGTGTLLVLLQPSAARSLSISVLTLPPSSKPPQLPAFLPKDGSNCSLISMPLNSHLMPALLSLLQLMHRELRPIMDSSQLPSVNASPQSARLSVSTLLPLIRLLIAALRQPSNPIWTSSSGMLLPTMESSQIMHCSLHKSPSAPPELSPLAAMLEPLPVAETLPPANQSLCGENNLANFSKEIPPCSTHQIQIITEIPDVVLESSLQVAKILPSADQSLCHDNSLANHSENESPPCSSQQVQIITDKPTVVLKPLPMTEILPPADQSLRSEDNLANHSEAEIQNQRIQITTDTSEVALEPVPVTKIFPSADQSLCGKDSLPNHSELKIPPCSNQQIQITTDTPKFVLESSPVTEILPPADQSCGEVEIPPRSQQVQILTDTPTVVLESLPVTETLPPTDQSCDGNSLENHSKVEVTQCSSQKIQITTDKPAVVLKSLPATEILPPVDQSLRGEDSLANHSEVKIPLRSQKIQITTDTPTVVLESLPPFEILPPANQSLCNEVEIPQRSQKVQIITDTPTILPPADQSSCGDDSLANLSEVEIPPRSQQVQITTDKPAVLLESLPVTEILPPADQSLRSEDSLANHSEVEITPRSNQKIQITTDTPEVVLEPLPVTEILPPADQPLCDENSLADHSEVKIPPRSSSQIQITTDASHSEKVEINVDEPLQAADTQDTLSTISGSSETESMLGSKKKRSIGRRILSLFTCCCFCKQRQ